MSLNPRCRAALGGPWQGTDGRMGKTKNEQRYQGRWQEGSPRAPCPVSEARSDAACPPLGGEPAPWPPGCPCWASPSPPLSDLVSPPPCQRKAQITCTAIFIVWGVLVHLVIPPFVFMVTEEWDYIEGLYYSFITISTIGFGDFVAGVNPSANYHALYRYFVELWIYLGLAWLSLFVNWKVSMFVEVHKAIKKRRRRRKESFESSPHSKKALQIAGSTASKDINIFSFLSKKEETYNDLIKQIGKKGMKTNGTGERVPAVGLGPQGGGLPALPTSLAPLVVYSKNRVPSLEEVSQTLRNKGHVSRPLSEEVGAGPPKDGSLTPEVFINQLDRISEEGEPWDAQDYHPLIFQNVNITFTNEEAGLSDEETSKSSIEDNLAGEERPQDEAEAEVPLNLGEFPSSDESTFTSTESELSVPYEQLVNEYNKSDCPRGT
uniref:Potassium two pore domain channel subfamily K member 5 n=1 Tax=Panthera leo TaxID=9689 RepID=A0A8C8WF21_PANLE